MLTHLSHALSYVLVLCLTLQIAAAQNVYAADGSPPSADQKHVLILFGGGNSTPALQQLMNGITSAVRKDNLFSVNVKIEILDIAPPKYPGHRLALQEMLRNKYATQRIDLIITVFNAGFDFLKEEGKELFPDVPAISILANPSPPVQRAGEIIPQFPVHLDLNGTLERALEMFPDTRRVVFVSGKTKENREREQRARAEFAVWRSKLEFEYPSDLPLSDLLKYVGNLPPKTIIIY